MPFREGSSQPQVGLLSTPTVSSVPGEFNYFSTVAKVIITAGASRYCIVVCVCVCVCVVCVCGVCVCVVCVHVCVIFL